MSYLVLARKYRPKNFDEIIGQRHIVQTLKNAIKMEKVSHAYIFSGMRGIGKTTTARILAKAMNCEKGPSPEPCVECNFCTSIQEGKSIDVIEIDGASNRGIDEVRQLREDVKFSPIYARWKIIIIDEVHMLTTEAFNALLKTLEEPPSHTIFILATTEFHKVPATIVSRCQHFEFRRISHRDIVNHIKYIAELEGVEVSQFSLNLIADAADGSLRDAESIFDQAIAFSGEKIKDEDLKQLLGTIEKEILFSVSSSLHEKNEEKLFQIVQELIDRGHDLRFFLKELISHFRNLLLVKKAGYSEVLFTMSSAEEVEILKEEAKKFSDLDLIRYLNILQKSEAGLRYSIQPRIYLETLLLKMAQIQNLTPIERIISSYSEPEEKIEKKAGVDVINENNKEGIRFKEKAEDFETKKEVSKVRLGQIESEELIEKFKERLKKENLSLVAAFESAVKLELKGGSFYVYLKKDHDLTKERILRHKVLIERILEEITGIELKLKIEEVFVEERKEKVLEEPLIKFLLKELDGEVISIKKGEENEKSF
ncbi:MAG: DNA polymerase III subunit gamma/tau [Acidobacteriota bacterium]